MKKIITVLRKETADLISREYGCSYMIQEINGKEVYTFVETERLFKLLNNRSLFSKKDWFADNRLRFSNESKGDDY